MERSDDSASHARLLGILNAEVDAATQQVKGAMQESRAVFQKVVAARLRAQALRELQARLAGDSRPSADAQEPAADGQAFQAVEAALRRLESGFPLPKEPDAEDLRRKKDET